NLVSTSLIANIPIITGTKSIPDNKISLPNVKRDPPVKGSIPTVAIAKPSTPESRAFKTELEPSDEMAVIPSIANAKYSAGPKPKASRANGGVNSISTTQPISPPIAEEAKA